MPRSTRSYPAHVDALVDQLSAEGPPHLVDEQGGDPGVAHLARRSGSGWSLIGQVPIDYLAGWTAPPHCDAIVLQVGPPHVHAFRPPDMEPSASERAEPLPPSDDMWVTVGVDRSGRWASRLYLGGEVCDSPPEGGRVHDVLLRCLDLPTAGPSESTAGVLASLWLLRIVDLAQAIDRPLTWTEALREHIVPSVILTEVPAMSQRTLLNRMREAPIMVTWDLLKLGRILEDICPPGLAEWMDAGMYSRWVLGELPDVATLIPHARPALEPAAHRRVVTEIVRSMQPSAGPEAR